MRYVQYVLVIIFPERKIFAHIYTALVMFRYKVTDGLGCDSQCISCSVMLFMGLMLEIGVIPGFMKSKQTSENLS